MADHMMIPVPFEIVAEVGRQESRMRWPEYVPAFAEVPHPDGDDRFVAWSDLNVAMCEQLVEHHRRKASKAIVQFMKTCGRRGLRVAAKNILYARLYRCRYLTLLGKADSTEDELPFPITSRGVMWEYRNEEFNDA